MTFITLLAFDAFSACDSLNHLDQRSTDMNVTVPKANFRTYINVCFGPNAVIKLNPNSIGHPRMKHTCGRHFPHISDTL